MSVVRLMLKKLSDLSHGKWTLELILQASDIRQFLSDIRGLSPQPGRRGKARCDGDELIGSLKRECRGDSLLIVQTSPAKGNCVGWESDGLLRPQ